MPMWKCCQVQCCRLPMRGKGGATVRDSTVGNGCPVLAAGEDPVEELLLRHRARDEREKGKEAGEAFHCLFPFLADFADVA